jgi:hypothetical protein
VGPREYLGNAENPAYQGFAAFGKTRIGARRPQLRTGRGYSKTPRRTGSTYDTQTSEQVSIPVPAIVSEELFAAVQTQLTENRQRGRERRRGAKYLLQGLVECACCGYAYYGKPVSRSSAKGKVPYAYYRCVGTDAYRFGGTRVCDNKQARTDKLDEAVWQDACELLRNPKLLRKEYERRLASPPDSGSQSSLKKQVAAAQRSVDRLIDAYADGVLNRVEFDPRLARARKRLLKLKEQLSELDRESREQSALREALSCLDTFTESIETNLENADWLMRREILRTLIERVVIEAQQIRIVYRINFPLFAKKASKARKEKVLHFRWRRSEPDLGEPVPALRIRCVGQARNASGSVLSLCRRWTAALQKSASSGVRATSYLGAFPAVWTGDPSRQVGHRLLQGCQSQGSLSSDQLHLSGLHVPSTTVREQARGVPSELPACDQPLREEGDQPADSQLAYPAQKRQDVVGSFADVQPDTARLECLLRSFLPFSTTSTVEKLQSVSCELGAAKTQVACAALAASEAQPRPPCPCSSTPVRTLESWRISLWFE